MDNTNEAPKALIAMSGGVDSSVAAYIMQRNGFEPVGITMKLYNNEQAGMCNVRTCCSEKDIEDARSVADEMGIPHYVMNYQERFKECVINNFVRTYLKGETPNPCIECNRYLKFGSLIDAAKNFGCVKAVTGHYARIEYDEEIKEYRLLCALDDSKDQTYVLYFLDQEQLGMLSFPLGELKKDEVRELAAEAGFINAAKRDSQDICFVPDGDYARVIRENEALAHEEKLNFPGDNGQFRDRDGKILGHGGAFYNYTIGQRKGLGISAASPLYVTRIIPEENAVILGSNEDLMETEVSAVGWSFINSDFREKALSEEGLRCSAKIRYRAPKASGVLRCTPDGRAHFTFDSKVRAVTAGQAMVAYVDDMVVGGGVIRSSEKASDIDTDS